MNKIWLSAAALGLMSCVTPAYAAAPCGDHSKVVEQLEAKFKETRKKHGVVSEKMIWEVFASKTGSWTMLSTDTSGLSCIDITGYNWQEETPEPVNVAPAVPRMNRGTE